MRDEKIYHEYANWKLEHHELLKHLLETDSKLVFRFKHVLDVVDYLYDKLIDDPEYNEDEHNIFETGFYYVFDQFEEINQLLKNSYQNDVSKLESHAQDVNLLLDTIDFQNELLTAENFEQDDMQKLIDFEKDILKRLEANEQVPGDMYQTLDQITLEIFNKMNHAYYPVNDIFYEIADELGILS